jgi:hypothetical protein
LVQQFLDQFDNIINPQMQEAAATGSWTPDEFAGWQSFMADLYAAGLQDSFSLQIAEFARNLDMVYLIAITRRIQNANQLHDWDDLIHLYQFDVGGGMNTPLAAMGWQPGQKEALQQAMDRCLTFELDVDSLFVTTVNLGDIRSRVQTKVAFSQGNPALSKKLKGRAPVGWAEATYPPFPSCGPPFASPSTPDFLVYGFDVSGKKSGTGAAATYSLSGLTLIFDPNTPQENFQTVCGPGSVSLGDYWWPDFGYLYQGELDGYPERPTTGSPSRAFYVSDEWQIGGGGGNPVLATRTGHRGANFPLSGFKAQETSTLTLKHTPQ